jgi:hypothetical protein
MKLTAITLQHMFAKIVAPLSGKAKTSERFSHEFYIVDMN